MSSYLSFADRENLLATIRELGSEPIEFEVLLEKTGEWARAIQPKFGFEQALLRNLTQLANFLRLHHATEDIASIARGAIQFIVTNHGRAVAADEEHERAVDDSEVGEFHALGQAFIASYAVHEIAVRLDEPVAYHPPAITNEEKARAEEIFEKLSMAEGCDATLIVDVEENLQELKNLTDCGFLKRMAANAMTLVDVLHDDDRPEDDKMCARGALRYFVEDDDAINDNLGLIGYLDDLFILQTAVDLVSPLREPLIELLDHVVEAWPFLNMLALDDGSGPRAASEFAILNSALSCRKLRSGEALNTMLVTPETGPIATIMGFVSALGLAHEAGIQGRTERSFAIGQKVLVDYEAVATFEGFKEYENGRRCFKLRKNRTERGEKGLGSITFWPMSDLHRLIPVHSSRSFRGELDRTRRNQQTQIGGLSFLFNGPKKTDVHAIKKQVVVVMPTTLAAEFCRSTLLYGQPIKDVVPIGQISSDGETTESWSTRFGTLKPVLLFASDLDVAVQYLQEPVFDNDGNETGIHAENVELLVVDIAGRNREKHASIKRLNRLKVPCLMIATERIANETAVDQHDDLSVWEWGTDDIKSLVWPERQLSPNAGEIARFEHRVLATSAARPIIELISFPIVGETHKAFSVLRRLKKRRGSDCIPELEEIEAQAFFAITQLMRCATELPDNSQCVVDIENRRSKIASLIESSIFLSDDERTAAVRADACIAELLSRMKEKNPKAERLQRLLAQHPTADVLCPDARLIGELENALTGKQNSAFASVVSEEPFANGVIVTGWFKQSRMASILSPPIANPVVLMLYDVEQRWALQFSEKRRTMRAERTKLKGRSSIFPSMSGWKSPRPMVESTESKEPEVDNIEEVQTEIIEGFHQRIYDQVGAGHSEADTKARLVIFAGGVYGLFTDNYRLNVVTHLLDNSIDSDDEKASVKLLAAKDVAVGDSIVFRPKSRDLIREVANEILEPGQREASGLWRTALREYMSEHSLSEQAVCVELQAAGCAARVQAITNWINDDNMIAPRGESDVRAIAKVTAHAELAGNIDNVIAAIKRVRRAHQQQAPRVIAKRIRDKAALVVRQEQADETIVHLEGDLVLVRVAENASKPIHVKQTTTNRLIEGDSWHE